MLIVEFDRLPSWFLAVSETGESTKCLWLGVVGFTLSCVHSVSCSSNGSTESENSFSSCIQSTQFSNCIELILCAMFT